MEFRWFHYIIVNFIFMISQFSAKPVSLNDILAAESKQNGITTIAKPKGIAGKLAHDKYLKENVPKTIFSQFSDSVTAKLSQGKPLNADSIKSRIHTLSENINGRFPLLRSVTKDFKTIFSKDSESDTKTANNIRKSKKLKSAKDSIPEESLFGKTFDRLKPTKFKTIGDFFTRNKGKSSSIFKKPRNPLKPKNIQDQPIRFKRRNQYTKQETDSYEEFKKYMPLLRNFGILVDNLLSSVSGEVDRYERSEDVVCSCSRGQAKAESKIQETIAIATTEPEAKIKPVTTEATPSAANPSTPSDVSTIRPNKNIPSIPSRNTTSIGRDDHGIRKRNRATFHGDPKGDIARDHRDSELDSRSKESHVNAADDEEDTDSDSRDRTSNGERDGLSGDEETSEIRRVFGRELAPVFRRAYYKDKTEITKEYEPRRIIDELEGKNHIEVGRDETYSERVIPEYFPRFDREISRVQVDSDAESVRSKEGNEKSLNDVGHDFTDDKRIVDGDITFAREDQTISEANEAVITIKDSSNPILLLQSTPKNKAPVVTIIDGYSVADKNGANKITNDASYSIEKD